MPLTVKGLLLSILGILDILEWVASSQGWATMSGLAIYYGLLISGWYDGLSAIALTTVLIAISGVLLFDPADHPPQ